MSIRLEELNRMADEALGSIGGGPPDIDGVVGRATARRQRRRALSSAGLVSLVVALAIGGWWSIGQIVDDQQLVDTVDDRPGPGLPDDPESGSSDPAMRGNFIWPFPAPGYDNAEQVVFGFVNEVLRWDGYEYNYPGDNAAVSLADVEDAVEVTLTEEASGYSVTVLLWPSDVGWGIIQIASNDGTEMMGRTVDPPYVVDVNHGRMTDDSEVQMSVNLEDGRVLQSNVTADSDSRIVTYPLIEANEIGAPDEIISVLLVVESGGEVIAVTGGQFDPGDEEEAAEAVEEEVAEQVADEPAEIDGPAELPPGQSAEDAARDGVVPEVAALPADRRINVVEGRGGQTVVDAPEGRWLLSELDPSVSPSGCIVGDQDGQYGSDFVCTFDYREIVLLGNDSSILKAYPMPSLVIQELFVTDEAIYCRRLGDGGYPDSILCRIDRQTGEMIVRVLPNSGLDDSSDSSWYQDVAVPYDIAVGPNGIYIGGAVEFESGRIIISDLDRSVVFDATTLQVLSETD